MAQKNAQCPIQFYCRLQNTLDHRRTESGFTLVEVLVGLALSTLLMLGLSYSFRNFAQTETRITDTADSLDETHKATEFLQQIVSHISLRNTQPAQASSTHSRWFELTPTSLEWIGVLPLRHSAHSENFFKITSTDIDGLPSVVLLFTPTHGAANPPDWNTAERRVLFKNIAQFKVMVEFVKVRVPGASTDTQLTEWRTATPDNNEIPIRIQLTWLDHKRNELFISTPLYLLGQYRDPTVAEFPK